MMFPEYFLASGAAIPLTKDCPRLYVLLFITVEIPLNTVSIPKFEFVPESGTIVKLPVPEGVLVN